MDFFLKICDLPDEMLCKIFGYIKPIERLPLLSSCRRFHDLIVSRKSLMEGIELAWDFRRTADVEKFVTCLCESNRCYTSLRILINLVIEQSIMESLTALKRFPSLVKLSLNIKSIELEDLAVIVKYLPNLEVLHISGNELENTRGFMGKLEVKKLKNLDINFRNDYTFPKFDINLRLSKLRVQFLDNGISEFLGQLNNLTSLVVYGIQDWDRPITVLEEFFNTFMKMQKLKELHLHFIRHGYDFMRNLPTNNSVENF